MCQRALLDTGLDRLGLSLSRKGRDNVLLFCRELQKWNKKINLIARNTPAEVALEKHFLDSLTLLPLLTSHGKAAKTLLDVGTGAGFPGLVLAAVLPGMKVTLVEPRQKRVSFLAHIVRRLGLANVRIKDARLEQTDCRAGEFSFITSRAVADINRFLPMVEPLCSHTTRVIVMRSTEVPARTNAAGIREQQNALPEPWKLVENLHCTLPFSKAPRVLSVVKKRENQSDYAQRKTDD